MKKEEGKSNLSYESDGKMGKENKDEKAFGENLEQEFFNITPNSE